MKQTTHPIERLFSRLVSLKQGEALPLAIAFLYHFFIFFAWYILRPIRDSKGIADSADDLKYLFTYTAIVTILAHPVYTWMVSVMPRQRFIPIVYRFFALNLIVFAVLLATLTGDAFTLTGHVYYVWTSMFIMFAVSVFWGFMADLFESDQAKRLFPFIAAAGSIGGIVGPAFMQFTTTVFEGIDIAWFLILAAIALEAAVQCVKGLARMAQTRTCLRAESDEAPAKRASFGDVLNGAKLVFTSPYLLGITLYILLMTFCSTWFYIAQGTIAKDQLTTESDRIAFFASVDLWTNIISITFATLVIGRVMKWIGVGLTLAILPVICAAAFFGLAMSPTLTMVAIVMVASRAGRYVIARPSREVLYTVVSRDAKYKAKNFNDTVIYRGGDVAGAWIDALLKKLSLTGFAFAWSLTPVLAVWAGLAVVLGVAQGRMARTAPSEDSAATEK